MTIAQHEEKALQLNEKAVREKAYNLYAHYRPGLFARLIGVLMIVSGNLIYGRAPSYIKFRAIEIVARIPYQSWEVFSYCAQTLFFANESRALHLARLSEFSRVAQDNETMHVVVISQLMRQHGETKLLRSTLVPMIGAFFYFYFSFFLRLVSKRTALEVNFLFENHAYHQYQKFLDMHEGALKKSQVHCHFLKFYGRQVQNEYEFFELVRNDELLHRNSSIEKIEGYL